MFKLVEETGHVRFIISTGTQKEFECPVCGAPLTYYSLAPYSCSYCFSEFPDIDVMVSDPVSQVLWHINGLAEYTNLDNVFSSNESKI